MQKSLRSYIHVVIQFSAISYFVFEFKWITHWTYGALVLLGVFLGLWAVWVMRRSVFSVFPEPKNESLLLDKGPYKLIRHPMYTALFLVFIPIVVFRFNYLTLAVFVIFLVNQLFKLIYEEGLLLRKFPDYEHYREKTWHLFPWIF